MAFVCTEPCEVPARIFPEGNGAGHEFACWVDIPPDMIEAPEDGLELLVWMGVSIRSSQSSTSASILLVGTCIVISLLLMEKISHCSWTAGGPHLSCKRLSLRVQAMAMKESKAFHATRKLRSQPT